MAYTKTAWVDNQAPAISAANLNKVETQFQESLTAAAQPISAALPRLYKSISEANDASPTPFRVIGLGSSVGNGATLPDPATQAPVRRLAARLMPEVVRLGNKPVQVTNGSVDGSAILTGFESAYPASKTAAGGTPNLLVLAFGMNDGMPGAYHTGQTYPSVYTYGKRLVQAAQSDGSDVIIFTTPHPNTGIMTDSNWTVPGPTSYPAANNTVPAPTAAASTVIVQNSDGVSVPASYRHLRVNEALRRVALETGAVLVDVEKRWFRAVAQYGLAALFDAGEYAHPNLLGHQNSYWAAIDDMVASFKVSAVGASSPIAGYTAVTTVRNQNTARVNTTTLSDDDQLSFEVGSNQIWQVELVAFFTGTDGDLRGGFNLPNGMSGRVGVSGPGLTSSGFENQTYTGRSVTLPDTYGLPVGGNDADATAVFKAVINTGSASGVIRPQWCQNTSSGNATTIYPNSFLRATRVS